MRALDNGLNVVFTIVQRHFLQIRPHIQGMCFAGMIGPPVYYVIWRWLFPQPYENLTLRLVGSVYCIGILLIARYGGTRFQGRVLYLAWICGVIYTLPFFFTYMLIQNDFTTVWTASTFAALFALTLIVDWISLIATIIVGGLLAWSVSPPVNFPSGLYDQYLALAPVFCFALVTAVHFNYRASLLQAERRRTTERVRAQIADEIRPAALGLTAGAIGLRQYLPTLLQVYQAAVAKNMPVPNIEKLPLRALAGVADRIKADADFLSEIVGMLSQHDDDEQPHRRTLSIRTCVKEIVDAYPFESLAARERISIAAAPDFAFAGAEPILRKIVHLVLENVLHNSHTTGSGGLELLFEIGAGGNSLILRDTSRPTKPNPRPDLSPSTDARSVEPTPLVAACQSIAQDLKATLSVRRRPTPYLEYELVLPRVKAQLELAS